MHKIPDEWTREVICPIFKKANKWDCNNYRGISLLNVAYKVYANIITRRLNIINEYILSEEQCGFRKGRSYSDCIFITEQLIQKRREFNLSTYVLFVDCEKAFDRVPRGKMWNIMKNKGFPDHIVKAVRGLYINTRIKIDKGTSVSNKEIHINQGIKQGCPMFPILFNIFIDEVIRQWQDVLILDFKIGNTVLNTILFAGDQAVFNESEAGLQRAVNRLENITDVFNMRISTMKAKTMTFQGKNHIKCKIVIDNKTIEQV
jgi:hypothetical protein